MTKKTSFDSWIGFSDEAAFCDGGTPDKSHQLEIQKPWTIKTPAQEKVIVNAQTRNKPAATFFKMRPASELPIQTYNVYKFWPFYSIFGGGSYKDGTGVISEDSGAIDSFAVHENKNGQRYNYSGCFWDSVSLIIPESGPLEWDLKGFATTFDSAGATSLTLTGTIESGLVTENGVYNLTSGGNAVAEVLRNIKITIENNVDQSTVDMENGRIYEPSKGQLGITIEGDYRADSSNSLMRAHNEMEKGIFNFDATIKDTLLTGIFMQFSGLQVPEGGITQEVYDNTVGVVAGKFILKQSETYSMPDIQVSGVDFTDI